jgi:pimeloyl-ACP methyl ester carboxylesterase
VRFHERPNAYLENREKMIMRVISATVTVFPGEIYRSPRSWTGRRYHNLIYFRQVDEGGHFAAWERPELFSQEIRAAFRSLR